MAADEVAPAGGRLRAVQPVVVDQRQGMAIVANCRQYALRIDPATRARMDDGTLDVVFFPCSTIVRGVAWFLGRRARVNLKDPDSVYATGQQIQIEVHGADVPFQIDGEAPGGPGLDHASTLELGVEKGLLPVLLPA